jgi:hypothetical protein
VTAPRPARSSPSGPARRKRRRATCARDNGVSDPRKIAAMMRCHYRRKAREPRADAAAPVRVVLCRSRALGMRRYRSKRLAAARKFAPKPPRAPPPPIADDRSQRALYGRGRRPQAWQSRCVVRSRASRKGAATHVWSRPLRMCVRSSRAVGTNLGVRSERSLCATTRVTSVCVLRSTIQNGSRPSPGTSWVD